MINIDNKYQIYRCDKYNYTYRVYTTINTTKGQGKHLYKDKEPIYKWVESYKYYRTLNNALEQVKKNIIDDVIGDNNYSLDELLEKIDIIQERINKIEISHLITKYEA